MNQLTVMDALAIALAGSFGVWWAVAPESAARFYRWFNRYSLFGADHFWQPKPIIVRVIGVLWIVLVVGVFLFAKRQ